MYKAAIFAARGVQDEEFIYPYYRLKEAGYKVDVVVSYLSKKPYVGKYGIPFPDDICFSNAAPDFIIRQNYDIFIVPGGWECPEVLRQDKYVLNALRWGAENDKIIGAICHGPQVLISAGLVKGKEVTCYKGMKDDLINAGGIYVGDVPVYRDTNLITSPHYKHNGPFMRAVIEASEL